MLENSFRAIANHFDDRFCSVQNTAGFNEYGIKSEFLVGFFMDSFETQRSPKADAPGFGGSHEAEITKKRTFF